MTSFPMIRSFLRLLVLACLGSCLTPITIFIAWRSGKGLPSAHLTLIAAAATVPILITIAFFYLLKRLEPHLDLNARQQDAFLAGLSEKFIDLAIVGSAALSLFLELAIIRWQGTVFEFFAFYKNFGLLSCFAGLGLGYALADRGRIPLILTIPVLAWQFAFMIILRFGLAGVGLARIRALPFREQLNMGVEVSNLSRGLAIYYLLAVVFLLTVLAFLPVGQLCGRLMERRTKLRAYGLNLLGSLLGVVLMLAASFLWTPPLVWFALCFLCILAFHVRKPSSLVPAMSFSMVCIVVLAWPVNPLWNRLYSPYQLLELGINDDNGLLVVRAAGHYYQRVFDFNRTDGDAKFKRALAYYEFPYRAHPKVNNVAVVGAGTGNDVTAALRQGAAHVDGIEIDPAILMAGKAGHPNKPYSDPRVRAIVNDARSFLRTPGSAYDMVIYGLLDSHTLLSQASSVRLDSFVYTVEGLREARARLKDDGVLSLSFTVLNPALGRKIYKMLEEVFDGRPPECVIAGYDGSVIFMESKDKNWTISQQLIADSGFRDGAAGYADPAMQADVSTDDWPFFYMPRRVYPVSYLLMVCQILLLAGLVTANFIGERPRLSHISFFCLGVGFMLVETKGITELGLTFGNTWQVIGVVIASILTMAFLANCMVYWFTIKRPVIPYLLLCASLALGWYIARSGGFPSTTLGRLEAAVVLTCPMFFSGIVFSTLLSTKGEVAGIMAVNLLGAVIGGLLEYNSMYFGFRSLYLIAIAFYLFAFVSDVVTIAAPSRAAMSQAG